MGPDAPRPVAGLCAGAPTAPLTGGLVRRALGPLPPMLTQCLTQLITSALVIAAPGDSDLVDVVVATEVTQRIEGRHFIFLFLLFFFLSTGRIDSNRL